MKKILLALIVCAVMVTGYVHGQEGIDENVIDEEIVSENTINVNSIGLSNNNGKKRGSWDFNASVVFEGTLNMLTNDDNDEVLRKYPEVQFQRPPGIYPWGEIGGYVEAKFTKPVQTGAFYSIIGIDFTSGLSAELGWDLEIREGDFKLGTSFNRNRAWPGDWSAIVLFSSYEHEDFGMTAAAYNKFWTEAGLSDWRLLYFRRQPSFEDWSYQNNQGMPHGVLFMDELHGYYVALGGQLRIDLSYRELPYEWQKSYRDYYRVSTLVARNWNSGEQSIGIKYSPAFLDGNLDVGIALTQIGRTRSSAEENYFVGNSDHDADYPMYGAFERVIIGAKYDAGNIAFSAMFNASGTGGSNWYFLNKNASDKDQEDGYFDIYNQGVGNTGGHSGNFYSNIRGNMGANLGARFNLSETFAINGDVEIVGLSDMLRQGMMAGGVKAEFSPGPFTTGLTARFFNWMGGTSDNIVSGGLVGVHPIFTYHMVPDTIDTSFRIDYVAGLGDIDFSFIKFNPKILWNVNSNSNTFIELGYTYRFNFNNQLPSENAVHFKCGWYF